MKSTFRTALLLSLGLALTPQLQPQKATSTATTAMAAAADPKMKKFIADLMKKMTLEDKIG